MVMEDNNFIVKVEMEGRSDQDGSRVTSCERISQINHPYICKEESLVGFSWEMQPGHPTVEE